MFHTSRNCAFLGAVDHHGVAEGTAGHVEDRPREVRRGDAAHGRRDHDIHERINAPAAQERCPRSSADRFTEGRDAEAAPQGDLLAVDGENQCEPPGTPSCPRGCPTSRPGRFAPRNADIEPLRLEKGPRPRSHPGRPRFARHCARAIPVVVSAGRSGRPQRRALDHGSSLPKVRPPGRAAAGGSASPAPSRRDSLQRGAITVRLWFDPRRTLSAVISSPGRTARHRRPSGHGFSLFWVGGGPRDDAAVCIGARAGGNGP